MSNKKVPAFEQFLDKGRRAQAAVDKIIEDYKPIRRCRICGCTEVRACITSRGPCFWVEPDLCSAAGCGGRHVDQVALRKILTAPPIVAREAIEQANRITLVYAEFDLKQGRSKINRAAREDRVGLVLRAQCSKR